MSRRAAIFALLLLLARPTWAQPDEPPFMQELFPPELIMRYARDVGITPAQRKAITGAVAETQSKTLELEWEMQDAAQALTKLMAADPVDEKAALEAASRVMDLEGRVKRAHLALLIRIRNQLDADQRAALKARRADGSR